MSNEREFARTFSGPAGLVVMMSLLVVVLAGCQKDQTQVTEVPPPPPDEPMPMVEPAPSDPSGPADAVVFDEVEPAPTPAPAASNTATQLPPPPLAAPQTYTIRKGDTLWSIAVRFYGDGRRWRDIVGANPSISDPKKLPIGTTIDIP